MKTVYQVSQKFSTEKETEEISVKDFDNYQEAKDYFEEIKDETQQGEEHNFERSVITAKFKCGQFQEIKFKCHSLEDTVRMIINFNLTYMGDKAQFEFSGRKRTINILKSCK